MNSTMHSMVHELRPVASSEVDQSAMEWNLAVARHIWPQAFDAKHSCAVIATPHNQPLSEPPPDGGGDSHVHLKEHPHVQPKQNMGNLVSRLVAWGKRS
jgi:hypothetical protein